MKNKNNYDFRNLHIKLFDADKPNMIKDSSPYEKYLFGTIVEVQSIILVYYLKSQDSLDFWTNPIWQQDCRVSSKAQQLLHLNLLEVC